RLPILVRRGGSACQAGWRARDRVDGITAVFVGVPLAHAVEGRRSSMHASFSSRLALLVCASVVLPSLAACLDHPLKEVEYEAQQNKGIGVPLAVNKDVDILFVVDNSGSMGEEQATLAANFASFIDVLERPKVSANYRIGVTT